MPGTTKYSQWWVRLGMLAVLAALLADKIVLRPAAATADEYHHRVLMAAEEIPAITGDWLGLDAAVPEAAVKLLHPNVIFSRCYENFRTRERVTLLLVQVKDARDIVGHYPEKCYPMQGWRPESIEDVDFPSRDGALNGREYLFVRDRMDGPTWLAISNFLFLPEGQTFRTMAGIEQAAQNRLKKPFGAGQVQFVFDAPITLERRRAVVAELTDLVMPLISTKISGDSHAKQ